MQHIFPHFKSSYLTTQGSKWDDIKSKLRVQNERNIMVFYFMQNDDSSMKKDEQQGKHMNMDMSENLKLQNSNLKQCLMVKA